MAVSSNFSTTNQYIKYNITVTESNVNTAKNTSDVTVSVKFWRTNTGYTTYGTGTVYCTINGTSYTQSVTSSDKITHSGIVLFKKKVTIKHGSDGSKSLTVKAKITHSQFSSDYHSFTTKLTTIKTAPTAPTKFTANTAFGSYVGLGEKIDLSWSGATGNITGYELQYKIGVSGWEAWDDVKGTSTTIDFTNTDIKYTGAGCKCQFRIKALNGSYSSEWVKSNVLYFSGGMRINVNGTWKNGTVWVNVKGTWKRAKRVWVNVNNHWNLGKDN